MYYKTDDPIADYERYSAEQESERELLPECGYCGEKIEDDFLIDLGDCVLCEDCVYTHFRKPTSNYIG